MAFHEETIAVIGNTQFFRQLRRPLAGFNAHGQHHEIGKDFHLLAHERVGATHHQTAVAVGVDLGNTAADVLRTVFLNGPAGKLVV